MSEPYLYFPGCNIPYRERGYEVSARAVAEKLGIELEDRPFNCCGLNVEPVDEFAALLYAARNIALAEEEGKHMITLCNGCYKTLKIANEKLKGDEELRREVNEKLASLGREFKGSVDIKHFLDVAEERMGEVAMARDIEARVASHVGCHAERPREIIAFDAYEKVDRIIKSIGSKHVGYRGEEKCCGAPLLALSEEMGMSIVNHKLRDIGEAGAELVVTMCPFCQVSLDTLQVKIKSEFGEEHGVPSVYITQLLGLALGIPYEELGFSENKTDPEKILKKAAKKAG